MSEFVFEHSSNFGNDSGSFFVFLDNLIEFVGFFSSLSIKFVNLFLKLIGFFGFSIDNTSHNISSGVEITF